MTWILRLVTLLLSVTAVSAHAELPLNRLLENLDAVQYKKDVNVLAGMSTFKLSRRGPALRMTDRFTPKNLELAREYLNARLTAMGYDDVFAHEFEMLFKTGTGLQKRGDGVNLWVEIPGTGAAKKEIVTYVAHYDTTGKHRPGANDNGTGIAALLAVADAYRKSGVRPKRTIRFLLTDGEERRPLYQGSEHFFESSVAEKERNVLVVNVDMLGYQPHGWDNGGFSGEFFPKAQELLERANKKSGLNLELTSFEPFYSDNLPPTFKGIPALAITEDTRDIDGNFIEQYPYYHQAKDKPGEVNFEYAMKLVKLSAATLFLAANDPRLKFTSDRSELVRHADALQRQYAAEGRNAEAKQIRRFARSMCMESLRIMGGE